MNDQAKITSKGQITVPRAIRNALGVKAGDSLVFEQTGDSVVVRPARKNSPFAKYRGIGNPGTESGRKAVLRQIGELRGHEPGKK
ncbi:MAG: AbrB/MazE/SpoVT family DNA-binding domain-containing protein [Acidobacteriota bacterium]